MAQPTVARAERRNLGMKLESVYGTDVFAGSIGAGDYMEAYGISPDPAVSVADVPQMGGSMGTLGSVPGTKVGRVSFEMMARGAGAAYSASVVPNGDVPLRACGFKATLTATGGSEKVVYTPRDSGFEAVTIYVPQENGPCVKLAGCCGDVGFVFQVGQPVRLRFSFTGIYVDEADTPAFVAKLFSATPAWPALLSAAFQVSSENYAARVASIQMGIGNAIDVLESMNDASGIAGVYIAGRRPSMSMDPEMNTLATFSWISKWTAGTLMDCSFQTNGAQYARMKVELPKIQIRQRGIGTRGMKGAYSVALDAHLSAGEDAFTLTFD